MVKWLMRRGTAAFERQWNYDASYVHEIIEASPARGLDVLACGGDRQVSEGRARCGWAAAAITAVRHEDCGPCTQLGVSMAERAGVDAKVLRAVLTEDPSAMPDDVALAWRFTRATLDHDPSADQYRDEIIRRWGPRAVMSLAFAIVASRIYPTVKYAMGHGKACTRIVVGGAPLAFDKSRRHRATRMTTDPSASFEPHRRRLLGLAYRMLGSMAEAEDAVQEAYLRWHDADRASVEEPRAFLITTTTRICLDVLKSARVRREEYVGPWLPDPVTDTAALAPDTQTEMAEDLSVALLLAFDRLSPLERAAFLLHDVFDYSFTQVADALGRNEAACRQLASRARTRVREARPAGAIPARGRVERSRREARGARVGVHHRVAIRRRRHVDAPAGQRRKSRQRWRRQGARGAQRHRGRRSCGGVPGRRCPQGLDRRHDRALRHDQRPTWADCERATTGWFRPTPSKSKATR